LKRKEYVFLEAITGWILGVWAACSVGAELCVLVILVLALNMWAHYKAET
jgi:hypothetical protein